MNGFGAPDGLLDCFRMSIPLAATRPDNQLGPRGKLGSVLAADKRAIMAPSFPAVPLVKHCGSAG